MIRLGRRSRVCRGSFRCGRRRCFPVVGGVLTHKDQSHITAAYGATLAPYLGYRLSALGLRQ